MRVKDIFGCPFCGNEYKRKELMGPVRIGYCYRHRELGSTVMVKSIKDDRIFYDGITGPVEGCSGQVSKAIFMRDYIKRNNQGIWEDLQ
jgi:hypothetical protein